jgi:uncharacterized protein (DUF1015 family)
MGALLTMDSRGILAKKIHVHEQIDPIKANNFHKEFSNRTLQSTPIILGVFSREFDSILNGFKINTNAVNVTQNEKVRLISNACKVNILELMHAEPELFLVDGHHRLNALQTLSKPIVAWVVSIDKLTIKSFIKVYYCKNINQVMSKINKKFNICGRLDLNRHTQDKQIHVYSNGSVYQLQINNNDSYVDQLCDFDSILMQENLRLHTHVEYHPQQLEDLIQIYKTDYIITTHTALEHDEIMHHQLLPIHTTCFNPKPAENSLLLFNKL